MVLEKKIDIHKQKSEVRLLSDTIYENCIKGLNVRATPMKLLEEN